jgi:DtxR family Mn-dependent transcriptional regulator
MMSKSTERIRIEDALKYLYRCERSQRRPALQSLADELQLKPDEAAALAAEMVRSELLSIEGDDFQLTATGRAYALQIIRAHRLWERYLADKTGYSAAEWHEQADHYEHHLSPTETDALAANLNYPAHDPHGDPIPTAKGELPPRRGQPLTTLAVGQMARIVHLEDEPEAIYAQLAAQGLAPGLVIELKENSPEQICFQVNHHIHSLAPVAAANITVTPLTRAETLAITTCERLADLSIGESAKVVSISPACRGPERRRFMDLGILPGTVIKAELVSPGGDPTAYLIRGALIALRKEQANLINIVRTPAPTSSRPAETEVD